MYDGCDMLLVQDCVLCDANEVGGKTETVLEGLSSHQARPLLMETLRCVSATIQWYVKVSRCTVINMRRCQNIV